MNYGPCWLERRGLGSCRVKSIVHRPDGTIERIEFHEENDMTKWDKAIGGTIEVTHADGSTDTVADIKDCGRGDNGFWVQHTDGTYSVFPPNFRKVKIAPKGKS